MHRIAAVLALVVHAQVAFAQDDLLEYREFEVEEEETGLTVSGSFETAWYEYDNLDFRLLDESSDQAIMDSDDRGGFPFTGASFSLSYAVEPGVDVFFAASHRGLWGNDQIGQVNRFGSLMYITSLYAEFTPKPTADHPLKIQVGRRNYKLGGLAGGREYILQDTLDLILVDVPIGELGSIEVIPVNVITAANNDGANFVSFLGGADAGIVNYRGDTLSRRHGAVLRLDGIPAPIDALAYGFYTDIGAGISDPENYLFSTGTDISYNGLLGNFTDNDWVANAGVRVALPDLVGIAPYAHFDMSTGIDRKELVAEDVDTNGFAWGGGVNIDVGEETDAEGDELPDTETRGLHATASYFDAYGPAYQSDGLLISHGYVGMKAQQSGGMLFNNFLGFHPTAYVDLFGVTDRPHSSAKRSGTRVLHAGVKGDFGKPWLRAGWWFLQDTGVTAVNLNRLDQIDPPFGYSRDEFRAEERMGKTIGQEIDIDGGYQVTEAVEIRAAGAVILPAEYYTIEIARVAGSALGSSNPKMPWGLNAGLRVDF